MPYITIVLFLFLNLTLFANESLVKETTTKEVKRTEYIALIDISENAANTLKSLKRLEQFLQEPTDIKDIYTALPPYIQTLNKILQHKSYLNIHSQNVRQLQKMHSELSIYLKQLNEWDSILKEEITKYKHYRELIAKQKEIWSATYENAQKEKAPQSILKQVKSLLYEIDKTSNALKIQYDKALTASQKIVSNEVKLQEIQQILQESQKIARDRVFFKNQASYVELISQESFKPSAYFKSVTKLISDKYNEATAYFVTNTDSWLKFFLFASAILLFVLYYNHLYRKKRLFVHHSSLEKKIFFFIGRPVATYTILFFLALTFSFPNKPPAVNEFLLILIFIPIIRILQTVLSKELHRYIYSMFVLWILFWIDQNSLSFELEGRTLLLIINLLLIVYIGVILSQKVLYKLLKNRSAKYGKYLLEFFIFLLIIAFASNLYGSVLLSIRIIDGVISTIYSAMIFYALYVILTGYIVVMMRRRMANASNILDTYAQRIEKTTTFIIKVWMLGWWVLIILKKVSLYSYLVDMTQTVLSFSFTIAQITISIGGIIQFALIGVGTWAFARFMRTLLEIEVFSRFQLPRGMPTAILTTLNYIIVITGTIIAFSSIGVTTQQFALIFGALGVGIGFGLRNIIANFISGIIMVFERPIQIGDTIEVDNTVGKVQNIGARSSTIKTFDGSEVIIPNADFISKEITNWTLSDQHRRKVVEFRVDLDNDIDTILEIMQKIAESHPDVLPDPKPLATLKSFGEYYLEFKLYFWLSENLIVAQSEVNINIYRALKEAGVTMPVPKTDIYQLHQEK